MTAVAIRATTIGENDGEHAKALSARAEIHGETAFCYLREAGPVVAAKTISSLVGSRSSTEKVPAE